MSSLRTQQRKLFRRFRADPKLWIERTLKIIDKSGKEVPFKLNQIQSRYFDILKELYWKPYTLANGKQVYRFQGIREVNLKARQFGLSSLICAILLHDTIFFPGTRTWLFCQDDDASKTMLDERVRFYFNSIDRNDPLIVLPEAEKDNTKELNFSSIASRFSCRSPGQSKSVSRKKGRSITIRNALLSELAEWPYAGELIQGLEPALNDPTTNIFIESSPKLKGDYFHRFYRLGKEGGGGWKSRFWPWFLHDEYKLPIYTEQERQALQDSLTEDERKLIEHVRLEWMEDLTLEQIKWRRKTQSSPTLAAKGPNAFKQEYPENDADCFESEGTIIFRDDELELKTITCQKREAIPGHIHVIGVDPADGAGGDFACVTVVDAITREQIFLWKNNRVSSTDIHLEAYEIWKRYPGVVGIESNGVGRATIAKARSESVEVTNENGEKLPLWKDWDEFVHCGHGTYDGLPTLSEKSTTIYLMRSAIRDAVQYYTNPDNDHSKAIGLRIGSQEILDEFDFFQHLGGGKMGAPSPEHDDGIMSLTLCFRLLEEIFDYDKIFKRRFAQNVNA